MSVLRFIRSSLAAIALACIPSFACALGFSPMDIEMSASGVDAHAQFYVTNDSGRLASVEVTVQKLSYTEDGRQITSKGGEDLLILPPTAVIPPGGSQTFRVQWVGAPDLAKSRSYLVTAAQLPVRDTSGRSVIQIVGAFAAILNVAPTNGVSDLKLLSVQPARTPKGEPALSILVENPTSTHALISNTAIKIGNQFLGPDWMRAHVGIGVVEPGKRRRFLVPLPSPSNGAAATLEYRPNH